MFETDPDLFGLHIYCLCLFGRFLEDYATTDAGCHGHLSMFVALKVMKRVRAAKSNPF